MRQLLTLYKGALEPIEHLERLVKASTQRIVLVFDEIENLGFDLSPANHWSEDFLHFWGAIRAIHQTSRGKLTFGVAGVNPHIFEVPLVMGKDNPVLLGVNPIYLSPLDKLSTREMVKTISGFMGLRFDEQVYDSLFAQYGGLPLMTRKACSLVTHKDGQRFSDNQLVKVSDFQSRQNWLDEQLGRDIVNMLVVLAQHYPDEFDNLLLLANGEQDWLREMKTHAPETLRHILGYGIIREDENIFRFAIGTLERVLSRDGENMKAAVKELSASSNPTSYESMPNNNQLDRWTRLTRILNQVEPEMRKLTHRALLFHYGDKKALTTVIEKFSPEKQKTLMGYSLQQIFNGESKALYLKYLKEIILRDWSLFERIFGDKKAFEIRIDRINTDGRKHTHSTPNEEDEVLQTEATGRELLEQMKPFLQQ